MQKLLAALCAAAAVFVLWMGVGLMLLYKAAPSEAAAQSKAAQSYVLKSQSGRAVLFSSEGKEIAQYAVYVSLLPDADKKRLEKGIPVNTREELAALLEDLGA